jgi:hypothetical protein
LPGGHVVLANSEAFWAATSPHLALAQIRTSRSSLIRLVNRLRDKRPVEVQGLAQVRCLLSDDRGPSITATRHLRWTRRSPPRSAASIPPLSMTYRPRRRTRRLRLGIRIG